MRSCATDKTVHAVIQARAGSSRLPGKVLRPLGGQPVLAWVVRAARAAAGIDEVVVATSTEPLDDAVAELAARCGALVVRGSETDVIGRYASAVAAFPCDAVVRLTADCPLLDPALIHDVVAMWRARPTFDYISTTLVRTLPHGLDVELVRTEVLVALAVTAVGHDRTHVTSGVYGDPERFRLLGLVFAPRAEDLRVTLDTVEDGRALDAVVAGLGEQPPPWRELVSFLRAHPEIVALNSHVVQKQLEDG